MDTATCSRWPFLKTPLSALRERKMKCSFFGVSWLVFSAAVEVLVRMPLRLEFMYVGWAHSPVPSKPQHRFMMITVYMIGDEKIVVCLLSSKAGRSREEAEFPTEAAV
ncbi:hypothetical protein MUK42_15065 [Musa troglodytarum]|uniref:Uncharacterized protein n=1 Tax=Musa troglodytarum TaxID=320322 RepID=A0A9E7LDB9_9LILI|nr:hypothetical protein MUK42_15065 [Musa troglodytarum]